MLLQIRFPAGLQICFHIRRDHFHGLSYTGKVRVQILLSVLAQKLQCLLGAFLSELNNIADTKGHGDSRRQYNGDDND